MVRRTSALVRLLSGGARGGVDRGSVIDELRRVILAGDAPPGSPIPVAAVAAVLQVSPIPVREALHVLVGERLVDHRPNSGYRVARLTRAELSELYLVRGVLEAAALKQAAVRATDADHAAARQALAVLDAAVERDDARAYHRSSRAFHTSLITPCRMFRLIHLLDCAWNVTEPVQPMRYLDAGQRRELHEDHRSMLAAFVRGDGEGLLAAAGSHNLHLESAVDTLPPEAGLADETG